MSRAAYTACARLGEEMVSTGKLGSMGGWGGWEGFWCQKWTCHPICHWQMHVYGAMFGESAESRGQGCSEGGLWRLESSSRCQDLNRFGLIDCMEKMVEGIG